MTAASPSPISQPPTSGVIATATFFAGQRSDLIHFRAASEAGPAMISDTTWEGISFRPVRCATSSSASIFPRTIRGELSNTQPSGIHLFGEIARFVLEGSDLKSCQGFQKRRAGQPREFGCLSLRYHSCFEPLDGRGDPHLPREGLRLSPQGGKRRFRQRDRDLYAH